MKHQKIATALSCVAILLLLSSVAFAANSQSFNNNNKFDTGNFSENVIETKSAEKIVPIGVTINDYESVKEPEVSADISEKDLSQGYNAFLKFINDNNLPVICDYKEFKQQYYDLGYDSIDDYLESIYGIFVLNSEDKNEQRTIQEPTFTNNPDDDRAGLPYSDEILDAYEYYTVALTKNGIFVEMSLEDFADEYEKSGEANISAFCSNLIAKHLEEQS